MAPAPNPTSQATAMGVTFIDSFTCGSWFKSTLSPGKLNILPVFEVWEPHMVGLWFMGREILDLWKKSLLYLPPKPRFPSGSAWLAGEGGITWKQEFFWTAATSERNLGEMFRCCKQCVGIPCLRSNQSIRVLKQTHCSVHKHL